MSIERKKRATKQIVDKANDKHTSIKAKIKHARQDRQHDIVPRCCFCLCALFLSLLLLNLKSFTVPLIFLFNRNSLEMHVLYVKRIYKFMPFMVYLYISLNANHFRDCSLFYFIFFFEVETSLIAELVIVFIFHKTLVSIHLKLDTNDETSVQPSRPPVHLFSTLQMNGVVFFMCFFFVLLEHSTIAVFGINTNWCWRRIGRKMSKLP